MKYLRNHTTVEELENVIKDINTLKASVVRIQQYEEVARLRDFERQLLAVIEEMND